MKTGLIVDLETTGLDHKSDRIIEIGMLAFTYDEQKKASITKMYGALEDPGIEIPELITDLTGIAPEDVKGQMIDWGQVRAWIKESDIVIAHNASFDSGFLSQRAELEGLKPHWGCSVQHIDWKAHGFRTRALNYLAADHGFVNPFAHRALFDCATTFRVISNHILELEARSYEAIIRVNAERSPFESKDLLKSRGYSWNSKARFWSKEIAESQLEDERKFLETEIYNGPTQHTEESLPNLDQRFIEA